jgi:hypothetical protein
MTWQLALICGLVVGAALGAGAAWWFLRRKPASGLPAAAPRPGAEALRLLSLLQQEGRLVDFLLEDLQNVPDAQLGAGVREVHRKCRQMLLDHLRIEPILPHNEGDQVSVPAGFDPSAIRLTGNVTGHPPFTGTLQHRGWRVVEVRLSPAPTGQDPFVLMPAEVELP